ncbi:MAG: hypothetical protein IPK10_18800 [Bacteroidetes bacterium]|nr:hypothetical protein [Bacteroidota bacterium]
MKNKILITIITFILQYTFNCYGQSLSPSVITSSGGYDNNGIVTLSWTLGETFSKTLQNGNIILTQGEQQPYPLFRLLNLKAFIEGFYAGGGQMNAVLYNEDPFTYPSNYCDSVTIELRNATMPFSLVDSKDVILLTDGSAEVQFSDNVALGTYFIVLRHRNTIETWSKNPILFNGNLVLFDFSN